MPTREYCKTGSGDVKPHKKDGRCPKGTHKVHVRTK